MEYPCQWIYSVYPPSIYMVYPWIYMVYHLMYIHGIYLVYCGISIDIPSCLKPDFATDPCCWSHVMRIRVWVIKSVLFHAPPWQLCQGKRHPTKGSLPLLLRPPLPPCPSPPSRRRVPMCRRPRRRRRRRRWICQVHSMNVLGISKAYHY